MHVILEPLLGMLTGARVRARGKCAHLVLGIVDGAREQHDGDTQKDDKLGQLFAAPIQRRAKNLQPCRVSGELEDPKNADQTNSTDHGYAARVATVANGLTRQ